MRKFLVLCAILSLVLCGGCALPFSTKDTFHDYFPVIGEPDYPGGVTRARFYTNMGEFWKAAKTSKPTAEELLQIVYDLDTVLDRRERQIREYNSWATKQNQENGYIKEF